jgi:O-antigen/teichoic acid export membrane protein
VIDLGDLGGRSIAAVRSGPTRVLLSALALIGAKVATMGFGFVAWIIAARLHPPAEVGIASAAVSAVTLCAQFALIGVGSAVITLAPRYREQPGRLLDTAVSVVSLSALAVGLLFLLLAGTALQELRVVALDPVYAVLFLTLAIGGTLGVLFDQASTARRRGDQALVRGAAAGIATLVTLVVLGAAGGSRGIFAAWVVGAGLVTSLLGLWTMTRAIRGYRPAPRLEVPLGGELVRVGFPNYLLTLTERAPGFVLPIVVTEVLSPADNAAWYIAWMMAWVVFIVPIQVGMTSFAEIAAAPGGSWPIVRNGIGTSLAVGAVGALGLAVLADPVLRLVGADYADAGVTPLRILLVGVVPMTIVQAFFSLCRARHRLRGAIVLGSLSSVASIVLPAALGPAGGLGAMALGWLAVQAVTAAVALVGLRRAVGREAAGAYDGDAAEASPAG